MLRCRAGLQCCRLHLLAEIHRVEQSLPRAAVEPSFVTQPLLVPQPPQACGVVGVRPSDATCIFLAAMHVLAMLVSAPIGLAWRAASFVEVIRPAGGGGGHAGRVQGPGSRVCSPVRRPRLGSRATLTKLGGGARAEGLLRVDAEGLIA